MSAASFAKVLCCACLLMTYALFAAAHNDQIVLSTSGKPLVKARKDASYKTLLSVDPGALRGIISAIFLVEVEQAIKRHLVANPELLPPDLDVASVDDFDINLVDYFDCMTGSSAGSWTTLYLASRGGQGAAAAYLSNPDIVAMYGEIEGGSAKGLIVFYREFGATIYPAQSLDPALGIPLDASNPSAPGVSSFLYPLTGLETALGVFLSNSTLADLDTSYMTYAYDLRTQNTVMFVQNRFGETPTTSSARLELRSGPRTLNEISAGIKPDLVFEEGKDYYLRDIGAAAGSFPIVKPAKNMTQVGSDDVEYVLVDGALPFASPTAPALYFLARELELDYATEVAVLTLGLGRVAVDNSHLADKGLADYQAGLTLSTILLQANQNADASLLDYFFYAHQETRPFQHLRVQRVFPAGTEEAAAIGSSFDASNLDIYEDIAAAMIEDYRLALGVFVRDFILG